MDLRDLGSEVVFGTLNALAQGVTDSLRVSSVKIGTMQRRLSMSYPLSVAILAHAMMSVAKL